MHIWSKTNNYRRVTQVYTKIASEDDKLQQYYENDEDMEHYKKDSKVGEDHNEKIMQNYMRKSQKKK